MIDLGNAELLENHTLCCILRILLANVFCKPEVPIAETPVPKESYVVSRKSPRDTETSVPKDSYVVFRKSPRDTETLFPKDSYVVSTKSPRDTETSVPKDSYVVLGLA